MDKVKLIIKKRDWVYIVLIGALFGFFISLFFYFLNDKLHHDSTIVFSVTTSVFIALLSFVFITVSNELILPKVNDRFWYVISFGFSFLAGFLGFLISDFVFEFFKIGIVEYISNYKIEIATVIGFLTFLVGLVLHQFVYMKYRNESLYSESLETKIKALENELNPHFLFNALNSISELIYIDQKKAEGATLDLSKFLRNAINKESLVSISSELDMVKTYLEIENIRFDNEIKLRIKENTENIFTSIPKFSIQLLVENAIKHGFASKELNIDIIVNDNEIIVSNDGKMSFDIVYGTGLSNLKRRLELLKVGSLEHGRNESKMTFIIKLKGL